MAHQFFSALASCDSAISEAWWCCTTRRHKTHRTEYRDVRYPWHPLFGQSLVVRGERRRARQFVLLCARRDEVRVRSFEMPAWMLDEGVCSSMHLADEPRVSWTALTELRRLLSDMACEGELREVEVRHCSQRMKGDADACSNPISPAPAEGPVRPALPPAPLAEASRGCTPGGNSPSGADVARSPGTPTQARRDG